MRREALAIKRTLRRYKKLAVPKELKAKHKRARRAYKRAVELEKTRKRSKHFKAFSKEYNLEGKTDAPGQAGGAQAGPGSRPQELGEDANKHTKHDRVMVMPVEKVVQSLGHLQAHEEASEVDAADKLDAELSDDALKQLHDSQNLLADP